MKIKKWYTKMFLGVLILSVFIDGLKSEVPVPKPRFGMNAGIGALDYDPSEMFADLMKTWREVTAPFGGAVSLDSNGWPLADCRFLVWHGLGRAAGTYHLKFTGNATTISADGTTVQNIYYNAASNTTTADLVFSGLDYMYLTFTGTSGGVKNVQLMLPGHNFDEIWNKDFLKALEPVPVIRLMDFTATNWNHEINWSDRTQPAAATQQSHPAGYGWQGKGIAWEYAIDLLNITGKDGWINIPAEASPGYIDGLISLIKNGGNGFAPLNDERILYIEYSNEVWNGMFDQAHFNHEQAVAEVNSGNSPLNFDGESNEWYWAWRRVAKRIVEISKQFRSAFGDEQMISRFRPVLAWQIDNGQATAEQQLNFIQKYYGSAYYGYPDPHPLNYYLWGGGGSLYYNDTTVAADSDFQKAVQTDSKLASAYGLNYCNYEGGMYFDGQEDPDWFEPWVTTYMMDHQQYYEEHGGALLMYFTLAATWENGLGFVHTIRDLNTRKYDFITQLSQQDGSWENSFGASLPMHRDGKDFSLISGDWESSGAGVTNLSPLAYRAYHFDADETGLYKVWIEYSSNAEINMVIYSGSELLSTLHNNTNGTGQTSAQYFFDTQPGLRAIRIENYGSSSFSLISVHVELVQITAIAEDGPGGSLSGFRLGQNYPNPVSGNQIQTAISTTISFDLPVSGLVSLKMYNALGQQVATLSEGYKAAGNYQVVWNPGQLSNGLYFYELRSGKESQRRKLILLR
jgi:hypothetical protein